MRFNAKANPVPSRTSHNTLVEVIWTVVPVLILVGIAIFSFRLLFAEHDMPKADLTIKATGNQWYWSYEYPDNGKIEFDSLMLQTRTASPTSRACSAVDNELVVPVSKVVRVLVTGADVIHAFAVPAFGIKIDAIPGRLNETWFKAEQMASIYGQCSELCGIDHAFMPIEVQVVSDRSSTPGSGGQEEVCANPANSLADRRPRRRRGRQRQAHRTQAVTSRRRRRTSQGRI